MQKVISAGGMIEPISFLSRVSKQGRNYWTLVRWLLYTAFKGRTSKLAIAIGLSLGHLASQAAAIFAVYWYGRQMEQTGLVSVPVLNIDVNLVDQPEWLWAIVAFSTICFVISATFLYLSRRQILNIVEQHYARSADQLVLLSLRLPDARARLASKLLMNFGVGGLITGCRRGALTAISFANAITAVVGGFGATIFLLRIDLSLTLLILATISVAALLLYPLTLRAVRSAKDREKAQVAFRQEVRKLTEQRTAEQTLTTVETADELARSYMMRRRVLTELVFATEIGITVILGLVIYYMASEAIAGRESWAIFVSFIAALRMTLGGAALAIRAFASVSRFYPQIVRYYLFVKDVQGIDARSLAKVQRGDVLVLGTLPTGQDVVAEVGDCLALVTSDSMRELQFALVDARLTNSDAPVATTVMDPAKEPDGDAAVVLMSAGKPDKEGEEPRAPIENTLTDKMMLMVYQQAEGVGAFGEKQVLTLVDGEFHRFALLGTEEGDATLKEFSLEAAARKQRKHGLVDDDDEEDDG